MNVGLLSDTYKMPNIALMKLSAFHKLQGDDVSIFEPLFAHEYDKVYYSKIFTFTKYDLYVHGNIEKGGTGFDISKKLTEEIDCLPCDYSIYPNCDYAVGFLTRGYIRSCPWCVVPEKEGNIYAYSTIEQIARPDTNKLILFDNNVLASEYGISEMERLVGSRFKVDFNQGLDVRLISPEIAKILAKIKWLRYIRVSCDTSSMLPYIQNTYEYLRIAGYKGELFCYVLAKDFNETYKRVITLRDMGKITPFVQPLKIYVFSESKMMALCFFIPIYFLVILLISVLFQEERLNGIIIGNFIEFFITWNNNSVLLISNIISYLTLFVALFLFFLFKEKIKFYVILLVVFFGVLQALIISYYMGGVEVLPCLIAINKILELTFVVAILSIIFLFLLCISEIIVLIFLSIYSKLKSRFPQLPAVLFITFVLLMVVATSFIKFMVKG